MPKEATEKEEFRIIMTGKHAPVREGNTITFVLEAADAHAAMSVEAKKFAFEARRRKEFNMENAGIERIGGMMPQGDKVLVRFRLTAGL